MLLPRISTNLKHIPLTLFLSLLILCKLGSSKSVISSTCRGSYNQTNNDMYQTNLQSLLSQFPPRSASLSFYNSTLGSSPDKAYALYLCRGDATSDVCHSCITNLTDEANTHGCYRGWTFNENCMLRYANYSFFGDGDNDVLARDYSAVNATDVGEFSRTVGELVRELITVVVEDSDGLLFATREKSVGGDNDDGKVYGLGQCTPDIGGGNCSVCLKKAYAHLERCCVGRTYAWAFLSSCQLRYDNTSFYGVVGSSTPANSNALAASATWTLLLFVINLIMLC